jgi:hypothetical protein
MRPQLICGRQDKAFGSRKMIISEWQFHLKEERV